MPASTAEADAMFDAHNEVMAHTSHRAPADALDAEEHQFEGTLMDGLGDDLWPLDEHGRPAR